jgi:hypothetical protein
MLSRALVSRRYVLTALCAALAALAGALALTATPALAANSGQKLTCEPGSWEEEAPVSFAYTWLRNGAVIAGAQSNEYTLTAADEGDAVQCQVTATNLSGSGVDMTNVVVVSPVSSTALPALEEESKVQVAGEFSTLPVGETLSCEHGSWENAPTFAYRWLRNGVPISGAESSTYTLAAADSGTSVQCQVIATNAGGSVVSENQYFSYVGASEPSPYPPYPRGAGPKIPPLTTYPLTVTKAGNGGGTVECTTGNGPEACASEYPEGSKVTLTATAESGSKFTGWSGACAGTGSCKVTISAAESVGAVFAIAIPTWAIGMTHANAYGLQAASCPGGHESLSGEPDCGVDPYTGSGTTFARESGFNTYTITVKNTAPGPEAGNTFTCEPGSWEEGPTFTYAWLRNGTVIAGAVSNEYTLTAADKGDAVQCQVTATNASAATADITNAIAVSPQSTALPALEAGSRVRVPGEGGSPVPVGKKLECEHEAWVGGPSFSYRWLRNGVPISGAESSTYTLAAADSGTSVQCEVIATNAGGSVVAANQYFVYVGTEEPSPYPPFPEVSPSIPYHPADESSGTVTVADQLPEGMVLAGSEGSSAATGEGWECKVASGATGVTCTRSTPLAPGAAYPPIALRVRVGDEAPLGSPPSGGVTNTAAVSGGGAKATATTNDPTTITPAVPFGIRSFTTSVTESLGNPFTQAGGHPFAANATFVFNYAVERAGNLGTAGGTPKDVETELPPGFIGNPQSAAKCTAAQIQKDSIIGTGKATNACPAGSVVGFVTVALDNSIEHGVANPFTGGSRSTVLVYNMEPSPGHPAAFGFDYIFFFGLNAELRSDGDYGVTVGDSAVGRNGGHGLQAFSLTLCSYGVTGYGSEGPHQAEPATSACANPTPGAKPFLTSPTRCEGPVPVTTLLADTYEDPASYVSKTVPTGTNLMGGAASASESLVTGCNDLQFAPEVEFKPSSTAEGGTTQADEPTGAAFDLKVPQAGEAAVVRVGTTLSCLQGEWANSPTGYAYQWLRSGTPVAGETSATYTVTEADAGKAIQCSVAATSASAGSAALSAVVTVPPNPETALPSVTTKPTISGGAFGGFLGLEAGETGTCSPGSWTGSPTFSYQWYDNGVALAGATSSTYIVQAAEVPSTFQCEVIAVNAGGAAAAISANKFTLPSVLSPVVSKAPQINTEGVGPATPELKDATVVLPAGVSVDPSAADGLQACSNAQFGLGSTAEPAVPAACPSGSQIGAMEIFEPLLSGAPKVAGAAVAGETLYCSNGVWNGSPTFSYQWLRDGAPIAGATGSDYALGAADEGKTVQCQVMASNAGGSSVEVDRVADVVAPEPATPVAVPPANLPVPSGNPSIGGVLSCNAETGSWSAGPTFSYQWLRGGAPIAGATGGQYTLGGEDASETVQCEVIATTGGGVVVDDSAAVVVAPSPSVEPPLLGTPIHGKLFLGEPLCGGEGQPPCEAADASSGKLFRLFLEANDPSDGVIIKIPGSVAANTQTGQLTATFTENPQLPFEELKLKLNGGPRAPLASPQTCGAATTSADLTPWSTSGLGGLSGTEPIAGTPDAYPSSSFDVDWDGHGGACPGSLPFAPAFSAGMASTAAGVYSPLTVQFSREDREQDLAGITVHTPVGVLANLSGVPLCEAAQANAGTCAAASQIGTTSAAVGPGGHPFWITDGRVYLTTSYNGAPFGLSIVVPADAGPFHLGNVVVRASIAIDPHTAAITVTSDPLPQIWDGVPLRLRTVNVDVDRPEFMFNATSCAQQQLAAAITGAPPVNNPGEPAKSSSVSSSYEVGGCASLPFKPVFTAATQAKTSKANGASLSVRVAQIHGEADIHSVRVELPKQLPSRLTTLQKACTEAQFNANPAGCPAASVVGTAVADTPVLPVALVGPAYFVSHGGAKFPELIIVLQGDGVTIDLAGETFISKTGVTSSTFSAVPDAPISSFELSLPTGPHSALAANANLCAGRSSIGKLAMPTTITGQNGAVLTQATKIAVSGCTPSKPTVKITKAKLKGSTLVVTVKTSATGTIKISGSGLKTTTKKNVKAGSHQINVALSKAGKTAKKHRKKTKLRASLTVGKQAVAKTISVKL